MRKRKAVSFFKQKSYIIAAAIMLAAAFGMTGIYYSQQTKKQEEQLVKAREEQLKQAKEEDKRQKEAAKQAELAKAKREKEKEETEAVSGIIPPAVNDFMDEPEIVDSSSKKTEPELHFDAANDMGWPVQGNVIMNYSMDQTIYFATLDQYKYNPAIVIQSEVNTPVESVAKGKVTAVETNEETGATIRVDMGDGYSAVYGQLKEIPHKVGDYIEAGEVLGYVSEPTKYYSMEGSNLYFELEKNGTPVNPMEYLQ